MDVVLVDSVNFDVQNTTPQLGLLSLHSRLKHEFDVEIVNFDYMYYIKEFIYDDNIDISIEKMAEYLSKKNALIYGFYSMCNSYSIAVLIAKRLKQLTPNAKLIFGGPHATVTAHDSLKAFNFIDAIGLGEGETYINDFIRKLINGDNNFEKLKGICFRSQNGIISTELPELLSDNELSEIRLVNMLEGIGYKNVIEDNYGFSLEGGRGCPFSCTFCSTNTFWNRKYRVVSTKSLIREMKALNAKYGTTTFGLQHDLFTANKKYLHEFCNELIKEDMNFTWGCSSRIDTLSYDSIDLMKKSGCNKIYVGLETGSARMQQILCKNIDVDAAIEKILYIRQIGISIIVSFIYGFPDESIDDFSETAKAIEKLLLSDIRGVQLHKFFPLPKTKEYEKISNRLYFDASDIDDSLFVKNVTPESIIQLVRQYPSIFPQFHTFESKVRLEYKRMDFMIYFLSTIYNDNYLTVRYLLEKYGLINLYDVIEDEIEYAFRQMDNSSVSEGFGSLSVEANFQIIMDFFVAFTLKLNEFDDDVYFRNISTFEFQKMLGAFDENELYKFDIDILSVLRNHENIQYNSCWVRYSLLDNGKLKVDMILETA